MFFRTDFDTFLSHNSDDKGYARQLKSLLEERSLRVWFDECELRPGLNWQPLLDQGLQSAGSIITALGNSGLGAWQDDESQAALRMAKKLSRPVIPVLLPGCRMEDYENTILLNRTWIDFRHGFSKDGIDRLVWGITGEKPPAFAQSLAGRQISALKWILVAGSGGAMPRPNLIDQISVSLGSQIAAAGFGLVTGGWDGVDHLTARSFATQIQDNGQSLSGRLLQIMQEKATPDFPAGRLINRGNEDEAWNHSVERADAVILVGGIGGTWQTGAKALERKKPVFPIADSRGPLGSHADAYNFYFDTIRNWQHNPLSKRISLDQFENLANPAPGVIREVVDLLKAAL